MSQPLSIWLSVIAMLISISSFILNLKNIRRTQKLDALQRRTHLLVKLNECVLKANTAGIDLRKLERALLELKNSIPKNEEFKKFFEEVESRLTSSQNEIAAHLKTVEEIHRDLDMMPMVVDATKIEMFLPKVNNVLSRSDIVLGHISATMELIEIGRKKLQSTNPDPKAAT